MKPGSLFDSAIYCVCLWLVCGLTLVDSEADRMSSNTIDYCPTKCGVSVTELNLQCLIPTLPEDTSIREFCDTVVQGAQLSLLGERYICTWTLRDLEASGPTSRCMGFGGLPPGK